MAKAAVKQTKKEGGSTAKGLIPVILFGTAVVVAVSFLGRKMSEK